MEYIFTQRAASSAGYYSHYVRNTEEREASIRIGHSGSPDEPHIRCTILFTKLRDMQVCPD